MGERTTESIDCGITMIPSFPNLWRSDAVKKGVSTASPVQCCQPALKNPGCWVAGEIYAEVCPVSWRLIHSYGAEWGLDWIGILECRITQIFRVF